jgi:hypothetical protein
MAFPDGKETVSPAPKRASASSGANPAKSLVVLKEAVGLSSSVTDLSSASDVFARPSRATAS